MVLFEKPVFVLLVILVVVFLGGFKPRKITIRKSLQRAATAANSVSPRAPSRQGDIPPRPNKNGKEHLVGIRLGIL